MSFVGQKFNSYSGKEIIAGVPVNLQAYFNLPAATTSFRALEIDDKRAENIAIRAVNAPAATAPATPATRAPTTLPAAPSVTGFNISLSNCKLQGQNYVCTATLTPTK